MGCSKTQYWWHSGLKMRVYLMGVAEREESRCTKQHLHPVESAEPGEDVSLRTSEEFVGSWNERMGFTREAGRHCTMLNRRRATTAAGTEQIITLVADRELLSVELQHYSTLGIIRKITFAKKKKNSFKTPAHDKQSTTRTRFILRQKDKNNQKRLRLGEKWYSATFLMSP